MISGDAAKVGQCCEHDKVSLTLQIKLNCPSTLNK